MGSRRRTPDDDLAQPLTLEVYYRYLPLYYRDAGYKMDAAVQEGGL